MITLAAIFIIATVALLLTLGHAALAYEQASTVMYLTCIGALFFVMVTTGTLLFAETPIWVGLD